MNTVLSNPRRVFLLAAFFTLGFLITSKAQPVMAPACDVPTGTANPVTGGTLPFSPTIANISGAIDGSLNDNDAAIFNLFLSAGSAYWQFDVNLNGAYAGDVYINSRVAASIFSASVLQQFTITAYNGSSQVWQVNAGSSFASWGLNLGSSSVGYIPAPNNLPYNKLTLRFGGGLNFSPIGEAFRVIEIRRVPFKPETNISGTAATQCQGATLTAATNNIVSNNITYAWYAGSSPSGTVLSSTNKLTNAAPGTYTVLTTIDGGCSFAPSVRYDTTTYQVTAPAPLVTTIVSGCDGQSPSLSASLTGGTAASYNWVASNGGSIQTGDNTSTIHPASNGTYTVTITTTDGCQSTQAYVLNNYTPTACGALPVTLNGDFTGNFLGGVVTLIWQTKTEINNKKFEVWKSLDGKTFNYLTSVGSNAVNGNSNQPLSYSATDANPANGTNYYQLKQIDLDGKSVIVQTVSVSVSGVASAIQVFPNPVQDNLNIKGIETGASYRILDMAGQVIAPSALLTSNQISTDELAPGIYILQITLKNGKTQSVKFIKK